MFADLSIRPESTEDAIEMIRLLSSMNFSVVAVERASSVDLEAVSREASARGIRVLVKATITASTRREARKKLEALPSSVDLCAVEPVSIEVARYAAANKRVSTVRVAPGYESFVDRGQAAIISSKGWGALEISLKPLLEAASKGGYSDTLRFYIVVLRRALAYKIPLVVVSDAAKPYELWSPRIFASLASTLGIPFRTALSWMSSSALKALRKHV